MVVVVSISVYRVWTCAPGAGDRHESSTPFLCPARELLHCRLGFRGGGSNPHRSSCALQGLPWWSWWSWCTFRTVAYACVCDRHESSTPTEFALIEQYRTVGWACDARTPELSALRWWLTLSLRCRSARLRSPECETGVVAFQRPKWCVALIEQYTFIEWASNAGAHELSALRGWLALSQRRRSARLRSSGKGRTPSSVRSSVSCPVRAYSIVRWPSDTRSHALSAFSWFALGLLCRPARWQSPR